MSERTKATGSQVQKVVKSKKISMRNKIELIKILHATGHSLKQFSKKTHHDRYWSPMFITCFRGYTEIVILLRQLGVSFKSRNGAGETPVCMAVLCGKIHTVEAMLDLQPELLNTYVTGFPRYTLIEYAVISGRCGIFKLLLDKYTKYMGTPYNMYKKCVDSNLDLLGLAVRLGRSKVVGVDSPETMVQTVVEMGFTNIDHVSVLGDGDTLVHKMTNNYSYIEMSTNRRIQMIYLLLKLWSNALLMVNNRRWTPVHCALKAGRLELVQHLWSHYLRKDSIGQLINLPNSLLEMDVRSDTQTRLIKLLQIGYPIEQIKLCDYIKWCKRSVRINGICLSESNRNMIRITDAVIGLHDYELLDDEEKDRLDIRYLVYFTVSFTHKLLAYCD